MASNDSGVETSNDSSYTNENSNSNSNSVNSTMNLPTTSAADQSSNHLLPIESNAVFEDLQKVAQKLTIVDQNASHQSTSTYKMPARKSFSSVPGRAWKMDKSLAHSGKIMRPSLSRALIPYAHNLLSERKLRLAASVSNVELLVRQLDAGVNANAADEHQRSPLHLAASRGYKDIVKVLLLRGADPNRQDSLGNTPLHLAVCSASSYNFNMVVRILLQYGARVCIQDRTGKTPHDLAKSKLMMMRSRLGQGTTPESAKMFVEMSMLTGLLQKTLKQQLTDVEFDDLEARLRNLSTKEIEKEADNLLTDVAGLTLN